jgi:chromosome segregation ATPase
MPQSPGTGSTGSAPSTTAPAPHPPGTAPPQGGGSAPPQGGGAGTGGAPSPAQQSPEALLQAARDRRLKTKAEIDRLRKQEETDAAEEQALQRVVNDIGTSVNAMAGTLQATNQEQEEIRRFVQVELGKIADEVRDKAAEIDAIVKSLDDQIAQRQQHATELETQLAAEKITAQQSAAEKAERQAAFERAQGLPKRLQERMAELKRLRMRIADEKRPVVKYVFAIELKRVWDETKPWIVTREQTQDQLQAAYTQYADALAKATADDNTHKQTKQALETARRDLEGLERLRLDQLLPMVAHLAGWQPIPPAPAPAPAPVSAPAPAPTPASAPAPTPTPTTGP